MATTQTITVFMEESCLWMSLEGEFNNSINFNILALLVLLRVFWLVHHWFRLKYLNKYLMDCHTILMPIIVPSELS